MVIKINSIDSQVEQLMKTPKYKEIISKKLANEKNFGNGGNGFGNEKKAQLYGEEMKNLLLDEINNLDSLPAIERFKKAIRVKTRFEIGIGWVIDVYFDEDEVSSNSLWWEKYENGAYLPVLFANGYTAKNRVYGYTNNGNYAISKQSRIGYNFIANAVQRFNSIHNKTVKAEYNEIYGGTLDRDGLASLYF